MKSKNLVALIASAVCFGSSIAATTVNPSAKAAYETEKKHASVRYAEDRKLCADEPSSKARMQCLRDAKEEYSAALKAAGDTFSKANVAPATTAKAATPAAKVSVVCAECGKITAVRVAEKKGDSTPLGMIAGGVAGAVLGHQVGGGKGKDIATIAGAAGGAYAGHKIEEHMKTTKTWMVMVHFDDGSDREFSFPADPGFAVGDSVKSSGGGLVRR